MTQAALQIPQSSIDNRQSTIPDGWIPLASAARIIGRSARTIQLQCQKGQRPAVQVSGGWYLDPTADPALRIAAGDCKPSPSIEGSGLAMLGEKKRTLIFRRLTIIQRYEAAMEHKPATMSAGEFVLRFCETHNAQAKTDDLPRTSRTALYRWLTAYKKGGIAALADKRGGDRTGAEFTPEAKEFILGLYLRDNKKGIPYIYAIAQGLVRENDWSIPALRTVQAWIRKKVDPKLVTAGRDPKKFRDRCVPSIRRDWTQVPAMHCWVADHRILDILLPRSTWNKAKKREEVRWYRPWLTMFLDCRSWMPVGWIIDFDTPNGDRVMAAFLQGVERYGIPEHVILDNGKDFRRRDIAGGRDWKSKYERVNGRLRKIRKGEKMFDRKWVEPLFQGLGVTPHFAIPYNARAKVIERWFGVMAEQFDKTWPTYWGNSTAKKPEAIQKIRADKVDTSKINLTVIQEAFNAWITDDYALAPSPAAAAKGRCPMRALFEFRSPDFQVIKPPAADCSLLLMRSRRIRVEANGVYVRAHGRYYWSDELESRRDASGNDIGRHVSYRYRCDDPSIVYVFDFRTDKFLCIATPYIGDAMNPLAHSDADRQKVSDAIALQRRIARDTNDLVRTTRRAASNVLLEAHRRAGVEAGILDDPRKILQKHPANPPVLKLVAGGEFSRAAQAAKEHHARQRRTQQAQACDVLSKTGTDDADPVPVEAVDVMDLLPA